MPINIKGQEFFTAAELIQELGVTRQTLWRWRTSGDVPAGRRYRNREVIFTTTEAEMIKDFADRIEPIPPPGQSHQLGLFNGSGAGGGS
jgi:hypothetical protein